MHFIEKIFGVSPDGGSGLLELALFVAFAVALAVPFLERIVRVIVRFVQR
jgi:hypothetical protein